MREEKNKALRSVGIIELFCNSVGVDKRYYRKTFYGMSMASNSCVIFRTVSDCRKSL